MTQQVQPVANAHAEGTDLKTLCKSDGNLHRALMGAHGAGGMPAGKTDNPVCAPVGHHASWARQQPQDRQAGAAGRGGGGAGICARGDAEARAAPHAPAALPGRDQGRRGAGRPGRAQAGARLCSRSVSLMLTGITKLMPRRWACKHMEFKSWH